MPTIAVLGAGPALGMSVARRFGREGFAVALVARRKDKLDDYVTELAATGIPAAAFTADLRDPAAARGALDAIEARFGGIDVVEYSPGDASGLPTGALDLDADALRQTLGLGLLTPVELTHRALPAMLDRGSGTLLFALGSTALHPLAALASSGTPQAGLLNYLHSVEQLTGPRGVHVGALLIGGLITGSDAQRRFDGGQFEGFAELDRLAPDDLAERLWRMHADRGPVADIVGSFGSPSHSAA